MQRHVGVPASPQPTSYPSDESKAVRTFDIYRTNTALSSAAGFAAFVRDRTDSAGAPARLSPCIITAL